MTLLGTSPKTDKGQSHGWATRVMYLAPAKSARLPVTLCPNARNCVRGCINWTGKGQMPAVQKARVERARLWYYDRPAFDAVLSGEIAAHALQARAAGLKPAVRLNGTSDLDWTGSAAHRTADALGVRLYDYTKIEAYLGRVPWHLTFSYDGDNWTACERALARGVNVAVAFRGVRKGQPLPAEWRGLPVIDGDAHDLRFLDPVGVIVGLREKLTAKSRRQARSRFFVQV